MSNTIPLHETRGLDPHMIVCPVCKDEGGLTVGKMWKAELGSGFFIYTSDKKKTRQDYPNLGDFQEVGESEKAEIICGKCAAQADMAKVDFPALAVIRDGGILCSCKGCSMVGAIKNSAPICAEVREQMKIPHGLVGIEFETCKEHGG